MLSLVPLILGSVGSLFSFGLTAVGGLVGIAGPGHIACQALPGAGLLATGCWGWVMRWLAMETQGVPGMLVACGCMGPGPAMVDCMTVVVLELVSTR